MGTSKKTTTKKKVTKVTKVSKAAKASKTAKVSKKVTSKKSATKKKATKKPVAKKAVKKTGTKKTSAAKKRVVKKKKKEPLTLHLHHEAPQLDPIIPKLPEMPEPIRPAEMGVCQHCHMLPAAAFELVIVMTCLVFSLSAVLLTSTQTIERQQDVIATLQDVKMEVYVRR